MTGMTQVRQDGREFLESTGAEGGQPPFRANSLRGAARDPRPLDEILRQPLPRLAMLARDLGARFGQVKPWAPFGRGEQGGGAPVPLFALLRQLPALPPATAALGLAEDERPVVLTLGGDGVDHVLVSGDAGAGKSTLLRTILLSLAAGNRQADLQLVVFDGAAGPERTVAAEWRPFNHLPHALAHVIFDTDEAAEGLAFLAEEMVYRLEQGHRQPRIVVAIDDVDLLLARTGESVLESLAGLAASGARAGFYLVVTATAPETLDNVLRCSFGLRLIGQTRDPQRAHLVTGLAESGAWHLLGAGDFLACDEEVSTRFQAAAATQQDVGRWLQQLRTWHAGTLVASPQPVRPHLAVETVS